MHRQRQKSHNGDHKTVGRMICLWSWFLCEDIYTQYVRKQAYYMGIPRDSEHNVKLAGNVAKAVMYETSIMDSRNTLKVIYDATIAKKNCINIDEFGPKHSVSRAYSPRREKYIMDIIFKRPVQLVKHITQRRTRESATYCSIRGMVVRYVAMCNSFYILQSVSNLRIRSSSVRLYMQLHQRIFRFFLKFCHILFKIRSKLLLNLV
jgi:hypothetical protein